MNALILPEPIATYFTGEHNPDVLDHCFTAQAIVKDDGHTYTGIPAIKAMLAEASAKYNATTVPFALDQQDGHQVVRANVSGNFPGSPVVLTYRFRLEGSLIASLEIKV
ncbi:nuclear transport factor 2 family protein [Pseudoduganella sp. FT55W]|uniref:Nuclear transport factor 2 family protein n=2 Tax=Duganella rivi TaxID=2666083 RepID=A0A7X4GP95_9BURK|nr:nuclear transport factor 2 family protein [Duganella rivi]